MTDSKDNFDVQGLRQKTKRQNPLPPLKQGIPNDLYIEIADKFENDTNYEPIRNILNETDLEYTLDDFCTEIIDETYRQSYARIQKEVLGVVREKLEADLKKENQRLDEWKHAILNDIQFHQEELDRLKTKPRKWKTDIQEYTLLIDYCKGCLKVVEDETFILNKHLQEQLLVLFGEDKKEEGK